MNENKARSKITVVNNIEDDEDDGMIEDEEYIPESVVLENDVIIPQIASFTKDSQLSRSRCHVLKNKLVRTLTCTTQFLENAHGSVQFKQGTTCVIAAAYAPYDVRMSKELPHRGAIDIIYRPKITGSSSLQIGDQFLSERTIENILSSALESVIYLEDDPGRGFNFIIHEYEDDGCILAASLNAAFMALMDSKCPVRFMVAAVTILLSGDSIIIDPSNEQINNGWEAMMTFILSNEKNILFVKFIGKASLDIFSLATEQAFLAAEGIFSFYESILSNENKVENYVSLENLKLKDDKTEIKEENSEYDIDAKDEIILSSDECDD